MFNLRQFPCLRCKCHISFDDLIELMRHHIAEHTNQEGGEIYNEHSVS